MIVRQFVLAVSGARTRGTDNQNFAHMNVHKLGFEILKRRAYIFTRAWTPCTINNAFLPASVATVNLFSGHLVSFVTPTFTANYY